MDRTDFAERHWVALDHALSRILPAAEVRRLRERFARRARALSEIYTPRLADRAHAHTCGHEPVTELEELRETHQALTAALIVAWNDEDVSRTPTN